MKMLIALAVGVLLSAAQVAAADTVPAESSDQPKQLGLQNSKKVMKSKLERDQKVREVKKKAHEKRQQAQIAK